jgi:hypothetical protein
LSYICLLFKGGDFPTPPDSDNERDAPQPALTDAAPIRPEDSEEPQGMNDGESEHDQPQAVTGRQKVIAAVSQLYPP